MLVQYMAIAILVIISVYAIYDIKKAILIWLPFKLLFNNQIAVRYESPGMALVIAGDIALFLIFLLRYNKKSMYNGKFPFSNAMIAFGISYLISLIFTIAPFQTALIAVIKYFSSGFCMLYLAHKAFRNKADIHFFLKGCLIVSVLIVSLAIIENIFRTNPWLDFVYFNSPFDPDANRMFYTPGSMEMRYGFVRSRSFFSFHIPFGFACVCFYWMLFYCYKNVRKYKNSYLLLVISTMLIAGVVMSNSKQIYLGLLLMILSLYPLKSVFNIKIVLPVLIILFVVFVYAPDYLNNYLSLTDQNLAEAGGGSTVALRESQYRIAWRMFLQSPIIGNGISSIGVLKRHADNVSILGAESSWLEILPERGILGAIVYLYLYTELWKMKRYVDRKTLLFFLLSVFVMELAGGIKDMSIWCLVLLTVYRYNQLSSKEILVIKKDNLRIKL